MSSQFTGLKFVNECGLIAVFMLRVLLLLMDAAMSICTHVSQNLTVFLVDSLNHNVIQRT